MTTVNTTRQRLLEAGLSIATKRGLAKVVIREVAACADVNLGSFVYHFGNRENFNAELAELWYAPIYNTLRQSANHTGESAYERLLGTLRQVVMLMHLHGQFIGLLLTDAFAGEKAAQDFLMKMPSRHPKLLLELVTAAQQEGSLKQDEPPLKLLMYLVWATGLPLLAAQSAVRQQDWLPEHFLAMQLQISNPEAALQRLEWALLGIQNKGAPAK